MELINETGIEAGWTMGFQKDGREIVVIVAKATYDIPRTAGHQPNLSSTQEKLVEYDQFSGEPGFSAITHEVDYAHHKPFCDVLVIGNAYAPMNKPVQSVPVALHVGPIRKQFEVIGERFYESSFLGAKVSPPAHFRKMPVSYDLAYGGTDSEPNKPEKIETFLDNPVGVGFYPLSDGNARDRKPLACSQEFGKPTNDHNSSYRPMALGPIGRNFRERHLFCGTYDQNWIEERAPFFPDDFDSRYFQSAPKDQQMPYPKGGESILLENLSQVGRINFSLPRKDMPVLFLPHRQKAHESHAVVDTIVIEPDLERFTITWRTSIQLTHSCFDLFQVIVGRSLKDFRRSRRIKTKTHYQGIDEFIRSKKNQT